MDNVVIRELYRNSENYFSKEVKVSGWVRTVRDSKTFGFIEINDGSFFKNLQIVFDDTLANFEEICKLTLSSSITVEGELIKTENANGKKIIVFKESYGNAFVPFLVDSYEDVYVIDYRKWSGNLANFVIQNDIDDVLFLNVVNVTSTSARLNELNAIIK